MVSSDVINDKGTINDVTGSMGNYQENLKVAAFINLSGFKIVFVSNFALVSIVLGTLIKGVLESA